MLAPQCLASYSIQSSWNVVSFYIQLNSDLLQASCGCEIPHRTLLKVMINKNVNLLQAPATVPVIVLNIFCLLCIKGQVQQFQLTLSSLCFFFLILGGVAPFIELLELTFFKSHFFCTWLAVVRSCCPPVQVPGTSNSPDKLNTN